MSKTGRNQFMQEHLLNHVWQKLANPALKKTNVKFGDETGFSKYKYRKSCRLKWLDKNDKSIENSI